MRDAETRNVLDKIRSLKRELVLLESAVPLLAHSPSRSTTFHIIEIRLADTWWAVDVESVHEVIPVVWPQPVPDAPAWIRGKIQIGDLVYPLIDLRGRLANQTAHLHPAMQMLISHSSAAAFLIDEATGAREVAEATLLDVAPGIPQAPFLMGTLTGAGGGARHLLSLPRLAHEYFRAE